MNSSQYEGYGPRALAQIRVTMDLLLYFKDFASKESMGAQFTKTTSQRVYIFTLDFLNSYIS